jgi:hypothetical protein
MDAYESGYGAYFDPPSAYVAMASQKPDAGQTPADGAPPGPGEHINFEAVSKAAALHKKEPNVREFAVASMSFPGAINPNQTK